MNKINLIITAIIINISIGSSIALAEKSPRKGAIDGRIKTITYNENDVTNLTTHYGYSTMIEFLEGDEILTISLGDTIAYQIETIGHRIFIKPVEDEANTNMQVVTEDRIYNFALSSKKVNSIRSSRLTFALKFKYPRIEFLASQKKLLENKKEEEKKTVIIIPENKINKDNINMEYTRKGSDVIAPIKMFDDAKFTYLQFKDSTPHPAIFAVDAHGNESLVNFHKSDGYTVIQRLSDRFILRHGDDVACLYNKKNIKDIDTIKDTVNDITMD